ncbi:MAG: FAD-dependent oxidoreductase [Actinobacteria bacterium]|nr:FAD-dependent oxidoreductase [Actinomycetota bacterium]
MKSMTFSTRLVDRIPRVEGVKTYRFERLKQYTYEAGQWFILTIPDGEGYLTKHFTHSSSPTEGYLDFTTRLTGSLYKTALDSMPVGTEVEMEGPFGSFTLREGGQRLAFITGGIGITPVRSILRYLADTGSDMEVALLYGNQNEDAIPFRLELETFSSQLPGLRVTHALADPSPDWGGPTGYIGQETVSTALDDPAGWTYYVSGPPSMVAAMKGVLDKLGITRRQMILESFDGYE